MSALTNELREKIEDIDRRIDALKADKKPLTDQIGNIDRTIGKLNAERQGHVEKLMEMSAKPRVSDHAVIRYLERKYNFDFESIRDEMLTPVVIKAMEVGADGVQLNGGTLKISGKTITTYIEARP